MCGRQKCSCARWHAARATVKVCAWIKICSVGCAHAQVAIRLPLAVPVHQVSVPQSVMHGVCWTLSLHSPFPCSLSFPPKSGVVLDVYMLH
jgi:hypothetical protein